MSEPGAVATGFLKLPSWIGGVDAASADGVVDLSEPGAVATGFPIPQSAIRNPKSNDGVVLSLFQSAIPNLSFTRNLKLRQSRMSCGIGDATA
jgi:hypothetical protein